MKLRFLVQGTQANSVFYSPLFPGPAFLLPRNFDRETALTAFENFAREICRFNQQTEMLLEIL